MNIISFTFYRCMHDICQRAWILWADPLWNYTSSALPHLEPQSLVLSVQQVAIAATWLASKLEEAPRKFRDVLSVFCRIDRRADGRRLEPLDINSQVGFRSPFRLSYLLFGSCLVAW